MGVALQDLAWARRILKDRHPSLDALGEGYLVHAAAASTLMKHYRSHPEELRPVRFTDAAVVHGGGGTTMGDAWLASWRDQTTEVGQPAGGASPNGITPAAHATGRAGGKLRTKLPHANFYLSQSYDENGEPFFGLFEGADPNEASGATMQTEVQDRQRRAMNEYQAVTSRTRLQAINAKNREFWSKAQR